MTIHNLLRHFRGHGHLRVRLGSSLHVVGLHETLPDIVFPYSRIRVREIVFPARFGRHSVWPAAL